MRTEEQQICTRYFTAFSMATSTYGFRRNFDCSTSASLEETALWFQLLHYITFFFRVSYPNVLYVIEVYMTDLVSTYIPGYVISCLVADIKLPPGTKPVHAGKSLGELILAQMHAGPVFTLARTNFEGSFSTY